MFQFEKALWELNTEICENVLAILVKTFVEMSENFKFPAFNSLDGILKLK